MMFVLICSVASPKTQAYQQDGESVNADGSYTVCHEIPVPPNYALVGIKPVGQCSNNLAFTVAPARDNLRVCNLSETAGGAPVRMPFPTDYIVKAIEHVEYTQSKCGGATAVYVIQQVAEGVTACNGSHIPNSWSYIRSAPSYGSCEWMDRNELHRAADGLRICTLSPYPASFVIGSVESVAVCGLQEQYVLRTVSDGVKACGPSKIPAEYVVTGVDRSGWCGRYATLTLRSAYDGVVVCPQSPIPSRYVIEATVPYIGCENWATAYRLRYVL
ncbi:hypothetical protein [Dyella flagellata]|nr:hypothetical protein [Dyella flagellata]